MRRARGRRAYYLLLTTQYSLLTNYYLLLTTQVREDDVRDRMMRPGGRDTTL